MSEGFSRDADAIGRFHDEIQETGWGRLYVKSLSVTKNTAFAAGYLEGALTAHRIVQMLANYKTSKGMDPVPAGIQLFLEETDAWIQAQLAVANDEDPHWRTVRFIYDQMDGMLQGANAHLGRHQQLTRLDMLVLGGMSDIDDIKTFVNKEHPNFDNMTGSELFAWQQPRGHCSALIKLLPDSSELFVGHNTWWDYWTMIRIFKRYEFGSMPAVGFSSFPGILASTDDFYQMDDLVAIETTNTNYNNDLWANVSSHALPYWIRANVANYLAKTGPEWMEAFGKYNSGTYNNMWMVVDYSKFTPGEPLPPGLLTVGEQLPGYFHYEDQTHILAYGYWPSFNVAVFPETVRLSRQDKMREQKGNEFSYQDNPRAQIFRRDANKVQSHTDMQRVMLYNQFQTDPLAHGNPCQQVACRGDLAAVQPASTHTNKSVPVSTVSGFGTIDAKYTSYAHSRARRTLAISGPPHDDQPAFDWTKAAPSVQKTPHEGQPDRFDYGWYIMMPEMDAAAVPWTTTVDYGISQWTLFLVTGVVALVVGLLCGFSVARRSHWGMGRQADSYQQLKWDVSPGTCSTGVGSFYSPPQPNNWNSA